MAAHERDETEMSVADARANFAAVMNGAVRGRVTYLTSHGRRIGLVGPLALTDDAAILRDLLARGVLTPAEFESVRSRLGEG